MSYTKKKKVKKTELKINAKSVGLVQKHEMVTDYHDKPKKKLSELSVSS